MKRTLLATWVLARDPKDPKRLVRVHYRVTVDVATLNAMVNGAMRNGGKRKVCGPFVVGITDVIEQASALSTESPI